MTEPRYFKGLRERSHNPRIHIEILTRDDPTLSSPEQVFKSLDRFAAEYALRDGDQLWLLMDRDSQSWKPRMMAGVARDCARRSYHRAVSNPCFEVWLLLHFEDIADRGATRKQELLKNKGSLVKSEVARHCDSTCEYIDNFIPDLEQAISRAEALDTQPQARWPSDLGTRVHHLVRHLVPGSA